MQQLSSVKSNTSEAASVDATRVTTYSLLAHINDGVGTGIKDLGDIFVPLVKRSLAKMNTGVVTKGESLLEIKSFIDSQYELDIPVPFLSKLLQRIAQEVNSDGHEHIKLFNDGGFIIRNYIFSDLEEVFSQQETEIEVLSQAFNKFLVFKDVDSDKVISIFDFLDKNRVSLSYYFSNKQATVPNQDDSIHAEFIESIKADYSLYSTLKKVYLGSIISGYLEINVGKVSAGVEYLLDTNFLLGLLELTSPESFHTCKKIVEICQRLGHKLTVLDDTIGETSNLLKIVASKIEDAILIRKIDKETIESACDRRKLTKTDLQRYAANLAQHLVEAGVTIIPHTVTYRNKAKNSTIFETFKGIRNNPQGALHDATAVVYVKDKRGKRITDFYEAKCWFVTNSKNAISYHEKGQYIPEIIRAEDLINILWLTSPNVTNAEMLDVGLTRLVSSSFSNSLPTNRLLRHLDEKIGLYAKGKVDPRDIVLVANAVADQTIQNLGRLEKAVGDDFIAEIQVAARAEEAKQKRRDELTKSLIVEQSKEAEQRIKQIKTDLVQRSQHDLEEVALRLTSVHSRDLLIKELQNCRNSLKEKLRYRQQLQRLEETYVEDSISYANRCVGSVAILVPIITIYLFIRFGWDKMEAYTFIVAIVLLSVGFFVYNKSEVELSYSSIRNSLANIRKHRIFEKYSFDESELREVDSQIDRLNEQIAKYKTAIDAEDEADAISATE